MFLRRRLGADADLGLSVLDDLRGVRCGHVTVDAGRLFTSVLIRR